MCDTFVALGNATADGSVIFGKNSDREPNEAHQVVIVPRADHRAGEPLKCTYIDIPQVAHTHAVLLAKPSWIWGAEMGANEHGVVIGNEAVFTKISYGKEPGLIGMDFLRLALERAETARAALDVMVALLEAHGQGGNCGFLHPLYYHNSFIIADPREAWVFETAGQHWAAQRVTDTRSISNAITIGGEFDLCSADLVSTAVAKGWCKDRADFDFARCYSDLIYTRFSDSHARQCRTRDLLRDNLGQVTPALAMRILRDHGAEREGAPRLAPHQGLAGANVCSHAGYGPIRTSQSVGSMVSRITPEGQTHFVTATSAPCTSIFKPVWLDAGIPETGSRPGGTYDEATLYWRHEALHREVLKNYSARMAAYRAERDALESSFTGRALAAANLPAEERCALSCEAFAEADQAEARWLQQVKQVPPARRDWLYARAWAAFDKLANRPS